MRINQDKISGRRCYILLISKSSSNVDPGFWYIDYLKSTTLCLLHRAHMPPSIPSANGVHKPDEAAYPSRNIAFRAAAAITSIIDNLIEHDELRYCPAFT